MARHLVATLLPLLLPPAAAPAAPLVATGQSCRAPPARPLTLRLEDFGASTRSPDNYPAFAAAVATVARSRQPAALVVGPGRWVTSPFNLTSRMTLRLAAGAVLQGTPDIARHPVLPPLPTYGQGRDYGNGHYTSLIHGEGLRDVAIVGASASASVVDGSGAVWWALSGKHGRTLGLNFTRGHLIEFINSSDIHISNLRLQNSPFCRPERATPSPPFTTPQSV